MAEEIILSAGNQKQARKAYRRELQSELSKLGGDPNSVDQDLSLYFYIQKIPPKEAARQIHGSVQKNPRSSSAGGLLMPSPK